MKAKTKKTKKKKKKKRLIHVSFFFFFQEPAKTVEHISQAEKSLVHVEPKSEI